MEGHLGSKKSRIKMSLNNLFVAVTSDGKRKEITTIDETLTS